ncbi:MAG: MFS transporter [archaeon]|nr:MFS transporter [archaeon]
MFISVISLFLIGSIISYFSQSIEVLILGRVLEGISNGILMLYIQILIYKILPEEKWQISMGFFGLIIGFAPVCGMFVGGFIIDNYSWRVIFELFSIASFILLIIGYPLIKNIFKTEYHPLDVISVVLSIVGVTGIILGFTNIAEFGFDSLFVIIPFIIGVITVILFIKRQNLIDDSLLNLKVFEEKYFVIGTLYVCVLYLCLNGCTALLPVYFQGIAYHSATTSALINFPGGILMIVTNFIGAILVSKIGIKKVLIASCSLMIVGFVGMITYTVDSAVMYYIRTQVIRYLGFGLGLIPVTTWTIAMVSDIVEDGSAVNNTLRQISAAIGSSIFLVIVVYISGGNITHSVVSMNSFKIVSALMLVLILILLLIAIFIIDDKEKILVKRNKNS